MSRLPLVSLDFTCGKELGFKAYYSFTSFQELLTTHGLLDNITGSKAFLHFSETNRTQNYWNRELERMPEIRTSRRNPALFPGCI